MRSLSRYEGPLMALAAAQDAHRRLQGGDPELPAVDLARYDALVGAPL